MFPLKHEKPVCFCVGTILGSKVGAALIFHPLSLIPEFHGCCLLVLNCSPRDCPKYPCFPLSTKLNINNKQKTNNKTNKQIFIYNNSY